MLMTLQCKFYYKSFFITRDILHFALY